MFKRQFPQEYYTMMDDLVLYAYADNFYMVYKASRYLSISKDVPSLDGLGADVEIYEVNKAEQWSQRVY